ncbi:hypothetical protein MPSEU_000764300 [Mayamaea pseudoterrestris]|nr:hypothetical protein MPSEU_000764300 [Mayamaea pseudoterrestris]
MGTHVDQDPRHSSPLRGRSSSGGKENSSRRGRDRSPSKGTKTRSLRGTSSGQHRHRRSDKLHESSSSRLGEKSRRRQSASLAPPQHRRVSTSQSPIKNDASFLSLNNSSSLSFEGSIPSLTNTSPRFRSSQRRDSKRRDSSHKPRSHDLLNKERALHNLPPLTRTTFLDKIAQTHATNLARELVVVHSVSCAAELHVKLQAQTSVAENVQSGVSMEEMHHAIMTQVGSSSYNNILGQFEQVGIGKARGKDGRLYMCQVFRTK